MRVRSGRKEEGGCTSPYTYKALATVYITYVVQFHDVSLQFRRRIFYHYPTVFPPRAYVTYVLLTSLFLHVSLSLSFSISLVRSLSLSLHRPLLPSSSSSGAAHHFVNQDKLEISSREIQPRAAPPASTPERDILGDNGVSGCIDSLLNIRFSVHTRRLRQSRPLGGLSFSRVEWLANNGARRNDNAPSRRLVRRHSLVTVRSHLTSDRDVLHAYSSASPREIFAIAHTPNGVSSALGNIAGEDDLAATARTIAAYRSS